MFFCCIIVTQILRAAANLIDLITVESNFFTANGTDLDADLPIKVPPKMIENYKNQYELGKRSADINLNITELIVKYGYPAERHEVHTEDGYILTLFRIPRNGPAVFLMHGLLSSADDFVTPGPDRGLAYLLAQDGYDVWMGNARGNKHSRRHAHLSPSKDKLKFWDFSWNEIGYYDLPAMIDYVLRITKRPKLKYVGFSQGTTSFFVMAAERPDYNHKISLMVALAPVAWMSHVKSPLVRLVAPFNDQLQTMLNLFGVYEFLPSTTIKKALVERFCGNELLAQIFCNNIVFLLCGFNYKQVNVTRLPVIFSHLPSGASIKQLVHYGQEIVSGEFRKFDYGANKNVQMYRSTVPPRYSVDKISAPVALIFSEGDWLSNTTDVDVLQSKLPNVVYSYLVPDKKFSHTDFIFAKDIKSLIYSRLSQLLKKSR